MFWIPFGIVSCFGFVVFFGAPYLPTLSRQADEAFTLLQLRGGATLIELGCGDGKMLIRAAKQGYNAVGYELNPLLFGLAYIRTIPFRKLVRVRLGNFWNAKLPPADAIFVFLLPKYMKKLDKYIVQQYGKNIKLVSFAFEIPNKQPVKKSKGLFLYQY